MTTNKTVLKWLDEMKELLTPDNVVWIDGSDEQREALREEAVKLGELTKLNQDKLPGCYLHRTIPNDVARVEDRTFICSKREEDAGPTNQKQNSQGNAIFHNQRLALLIYFRDISAHPQINPLIVYHGFTDTDNVVVFIHPYNCNPIITAVFK